MRVATTRMSSRGQVVIPEEIRNLLGFEEGSQFVVVGRGDTVILKAICPPPVEQFQLLLEEARRAVRQAGIKKADLVVAVKKARRQK